MKKLIFCFTLVFILILSSCYFDFKEAVATPVLSFINERTYSYEIEFSCETEDATVYYTIYDTIFGYSIESSSSVSMGSSLFIDKGSTITFYASKDGCYSSEMVTVKIPYGKLSTPIIQLKGLLSENTNYRVFEIKCNDSEHIYYTTDGTVPTSQSTLYVPSAYTVLGGSTVYGIKVLSDQPLSAIGCSDDWTDSDVASYSSSTVNLNSAWRAYQGTELDYDKQKYNAYESFSTHNQSDSTARMTIEVSNCNSFTIKVRSDAEPYYDGIVVYQIDSTSIVRANTKNNQGEWLPITFSNLNMQHHVITIDFKKDDQRNVEPDCGYVLVPKY